jgi:hypothetical protein
LFVIFDLSCFEGALPRVAKYFSRSAPPSPRTFEIRLRTIGALRLRQAQGRIVPVKPGHFRIESLVKQGIPSVLPQKTLKICRFCAAQSAGK